MKRTIKLASIILSVMMLISCIVGCGNSESSGSSEKITSSSQAISAVKNYLSGTAFSLDQRIASELGFNNFYDPQYGTSSADQNSDGSWKVTIKGSMTGYVDEYHDDLETYKFEANATVSESGNVSISVRKVY